MTDDQLKEIFSYHAATNEQAAAYDQINAAFLASAQMLNAVLPEGPGKTVAIRKLSEARMQANHCVALEGRF